MLSYSTSFTFFALLPHIVSRLSLFAIVGGGLSEGLYISKGRRVTEDCAELRMSLAPLDCTPKCRSQQHADQVVAALTGGTEGQLRAFLTSHCYNAATLRDAFGRTALHLAASLGKKALLEWLLESKNADLTVKDKESGWTALHRSAFYGQIHCLMSLVKVQSIWKKITLLDKCINLQLHLSNLHSKYDDRVKMCLESSS